MQLRPKPYNIMGYHDAAKKALPRAVFHYVAGGAEDESTLASNRAGFSVVRLRSRIHDTNSPIDTATYLCGQRLELPIVLAPVGSAGLIHPDGDLGAARAASRYGALMMLSSAATYTIDEIGRAVEPKPWLQLYLLRDREFYGRLIDRAAAAGFRGLAVTVDTAQPGRRERDIANAFSVPPRLTLRNALSIAGHPRWTARVVRHRRAQIKIFDETSTTPTLRTFVRETKRLSVEFGSALRRVTWDDLALIRERWQGPLAVKGVVDPSDAKRAADLGIDVIIVSNHGGRQLDGAVSALMALAPIVEAVGGQSEVILDGGVRRGTDIIKALCLGARAVMIGRPWVFGLAVGGQEGVEAVLEALRNELTLSLDLLGQPCVRNLDRTYLAPVQSSG